MAAPLSLPTQINLFRAELEFSKNLAPLTVFRGMAQASLNFGGASAYFRKSEFNPRDGKLAAVETILAMDPLETILFKNGRALVKSPQGGLIKVGSPFTIAAERIGNYRKLDPRFSASRNLKSNAAFSGGALGYFAYDCVRFLEPTLLDYPGNLQAARQKKDVLESEIFFFGQFIIFDHRVNKIRLIAQTAHELEQLKTMLRSPRHEEKNARNSKSSPAPLKTMFGKSRYLAGVKKLKSHIRQGDIFQAVLSEKFKLPFRGSPLDLFETLAQINPSPYEFYLSNGKQTRLGCSPEMLLKISEGKLETHPIAGTRPRGKNAKEEKKLEAQLKSSVKEKAEHLMLVDLARNDLGRVAKPGSVEVEDYMQIKKFGSVMHLVSRVKGELKPTIPPLEALAACFPAGTLSGAPKIRAMELLSELEPDRRGFYGGAVIAADLNGNLDSCISIRCIEIDGGIATIQAGAGIVADSQPTLEYAEIEHKTRMTRAALASQLGKNTRRPSERKYRRENK